MYLNEKVKEVSKSDYLSLFSRKLNKKFSQHYNFFEALSQYIDKAYLYLEDSGILSRYILLNNEFEIEFEVEPSDVLYSFGCYRISIYFCADDIFDYHESFSKFVGEGILNYCCNKIYCDYHIFRKDLYKTIYDILGCEVHIDKFQVLDNGLVSLPLLVYYNVDFDISNYEKYQKNVVTDLSYTQFNKLNVKNVVKFKFVSKNVYGCEEFLKYVQSNIYCKGTIIDGLILDYNDKEDSKSKVGNKKIDNKEYFESKLKELRNLENIKIEYIEIYPFEYHIRVIKMG